jgi:hypothetical protein
MKLVMRHRFVRHPRYGETVLIARQYAYRGAELVVIPQPNGLP